MITTLLSCLVMELNSVVSQLYDVHIKTAESVQVLFWPDLDNQTFFVLGGWVGAWEVKLTFSFAFDLRYTRAAPYYFYPFYYQSWVRVRIYSTCIGQIAWG